MNIGNKINLEKLYDIENFNKYDNKWAIHLKDSVFTKILYSIDENVIQRFTEKYPNNKIYKVIGEDQYILIGLYKHLAPVYGHFYNHWDDMIAKSSKYSNRFLLIKRKNIFCNEYDHPVLYDKLAKCKEKIEILKTDKINLCYEDSYDFLNKYEQSDTYELYSHNEVSSEDIINPGE